MASLVKEYTKEKLYGQIYTPSFIVNKILDDINYRSISILGKKILDPACGDGRFLIEIAKRIIEYSPVNDLKKNLECIYGWDIDTDAIKECMKNLNELIVHYTIHVDWNIYEQDSLQKYTSPSLFGFTCIEQFDFIVGNPPYIRIQHLDFEQRQYIQSQYSFCKNGSTDIYIAFYELCINLLSKIGVCGLITPNTFLYTETARALRQYFVINKNLLQISNYGEIQLFENASTYSTVTIFNMQENEKIKYQQAITKDTFKEKYFTFNQLKEPFWQLSTQTFSKSNGEKLKNICNIHVGVTTLHDKSYIFEIEDIDNDYAYALTKIKGKVKIEKSILKPIIKASRLKNSQQKISEYILFPYHKKNGKHTILNEEIIKEEFPFAYQYLCSIKIELDKRDNGKPISPTWYSFGRSQGLDTSFGKKIIFSPMNHTPNFVYSDNEEALFYSGYCIKYDGNVHKLLQQLNSQKMIDFISMSSRDFRGGWKAYNKKIVENFEVEI